MNLNGKIAVVSGAGSGIGRQLVIQLANKGATVVGADINPETLNESMELIADGSADHMAHVLNIADGKKVASFAEEVVKKYGSVDVLINNAGIIQPFVTVSALTLDQIQRIFDVNLWGTVFMIKAFLPHLRNSPDAHLVNLSSMGAFVPVPGQVIYGASKAAIQLLTEGLISELHGTSVNATIVFPGAVDTNIAQNAPDITKEDLEKLGGSATSSEETQSTSAADAAAQILEAIENNQKRLYVGKDSKMMHLVSRISMNKASDLIRDQLEKAIGPVKDA